MDNDEFKPFLVQGDHGVGKTSYANSLIADVYGNVFNGGVPYWNSFKPSVRDWFASHIGFHPDEVIKEWKYKDNREKWLNDNLGPYPRSVLNKWEKIDGKRDYVYHWDDAGVWLHSLDFQDPFVKEVGKYMQLVRSDWACVIFSAISVEDITSKVRGLRNAIIIDVVKHSDKLHPYRRVAEAYILRKTFRGRVWKDYQWKDNFDCHVPDAFYEWYHPLRDRYAEIAKVRMMKKLEANEDLRSTE